MTDYKRAEPLHLDMNWDEALMRLIQTDPDELPEKVRLRKPENPRKKKGRGTKPLPSKATRHDGSGG